MAQAAAHGGATEKERLLLHEQDAESRWSLLRKSDERELAAILKEERNAPQWKVLTIMAVFVVVIIINLPRCATDSIQLTACLPAWLPACLLARLPATRL